MFDSKHMRISDWFFFIVLMAIPILNVVVVILLLMNPKTNVSLKNLLWTLVILVLVGGFSWLTLYVFIISRY